MVNAGEQSVAAIHDAVQRPDGSGSLIFCCHARTLNSWGRLGAMSFASKALRDEAVRVRSLSKFTSDQRALQTIEDHAADLMTRADEMDRLNAEDERAERES
ncbi:hypothetical protein [Brevundimonas sp. EYE_349]|uniref:hypothetical protein n=1 Tax=Brevundimonas sp. EYE_349 TaxID=2853455 RepID=UPI00200657DC|nr:hypothetical protein [Brevundimonas sp. EYE_349]MCK6106069.1 hypothetical protein [Brevundimonas sp. EYE_349]